MLRRLKLTAVSVVVLGWALPNQAAAQAWSFVSSPDLFNSDIGDLSGGTIAAINDTFPDPTGYAAALNSLSTPAFSNNGFNSLTPGMATAYNALLAEMQQNAGGSADTFLVAGDLLNGRWPQNGAALRNNFGGATTSAAIDNAADVYYGFYRELFRQHGFTNALGAIGDHDIGDNDWSTGSSRANHVDDMKRAFGRTMVDPLGLPATWNGISSTAPAGQGEYDEGSFIQQKNNVLFVTVDVFRWEGPGVQQHPWFGSVRPEVSGSVGDVGTHLGWLDAVLTAADNDQTVDHVVVQGHTPVLAGVRKQASSGMMMQQRGDSAFWSVLRDHDHGSGGKVRMYFGGEVHTVTSTKDPESEIVQLVHGNPPLGGGGTNYVVFDVNGPSIEARLYNVDLQGGGGSYWQVSQGFQGGPGGLTAGELTGTLRIDASAAQTAYETTGHLDFVRSRGVLANYGFDAFTNSGQISNTGSLTDLFYSANINGNPESVPGRFGEAMAFDGAGDYLRTAGGLAPISEGEQRTVAAWVRTTANGTQAIFGYGQDNRNNGEFNVQLVDGVLTLKTDAGITASAANTPINDGLWRHVAVVVPGRDANTLGEVRFYVDGIEHAPVTSTPTRPVFTFAGSQSNLHVGANAENLSSGQHFNGSLDEVSMWGASLDPARVRSLVNAGNEAELRLDTLEMESLFSVFDTQRGSVSAGGYDWTPAGGLPGAGGDVFRLDAFRYGIVLDDSGNGIVGDPGVVLIVDRNTGEARIENRSGEALVLDGYTIHSTGGSLDPSDGAWQSRFDQQVPGWVEANPTSVRLTEANLDGSGDTLAANGVFDLGAPFTPSPSSFGELVEDLTFRYFTPEGAELTGVVNYRGAKVNNLTLIIDSDTGEARLVNASDFDVQLEGYTIAASSADLDVSGWISLQDGSTPEWVEANPTAERISEVHLGGGTLVEAGGEFDLGDLFSSEAPIAGLTLSYWLAGDDLPRGRDGRVLYQSDETADLPGDFNGDGRVDAADYTVWRDALGGAESALGGAGDGSGTVDDGDYQLWRSRYGDTSAEAAVSTPEPSSAVLASILILEATSRAGGRRQRSSSNHNNHEGL